MRKYAEHWEAVVLRHIKDKTVNNKLLEDHYRHIIWLQHERLVHLMVMLFIALALLVVFVLTLMIPGVLIGVLLFVLIILTGFYVRHYYYLENTVQYWYKLADEMSLVEFSK